MNKFEFRVTLESENNKIRNAIENNSKHGLTITELTDVLVTAEKGYDALLKSFITSDFSLSTSRVSDIVETLETLDNTFSSFLQDMKNRESSILVKDLYSIVAIRGSFGFMFDLASVVRIMIRSQFPSKYTENSIIACLSLDKHVDRSKSKYHDPLINTLKTLHASVEVFQMELMDLSKSVIKAIKDKTDPTQNWERCLKALSDVIKIAKML